MDDDESYYKALDTMDRLHAYMEDIGSNFYQLNKKMGSRSSGIFYNTYLNGNVFRVKKYIRICKALNISLLYILCKKPLKPYVETELNVPFVIECYDNTKYSSKSYKNYNGLRAIVSYLRRSPNRNLSIKSLYELERLTGVPCYKYFTNWEKMV